MTSDVIRRHYMSYNPLFYKCLHGHNFAKSEPMNGLEHLPTDSSTPLTSRSNPPEVDSLFKRTEQVVFLSDKNCFVRQKPRPPGKGGNICSKVAISEEKKYKSQYQTDGVSMVALPDLNMKKTMNTRLKSVKPITLIIRWMIRHG